MAFSSPEANHSGRTCPGSAWICGSCLHYLVSLGKWVLGSSQRWFQITFTKSLIIPTQARRYARRGPSLSSSPSLDSDRGYDGSYGMSANRIAVNE